MQIEWKDIEEFPGYQVSNDGQVRCCRVLGYKCPDKIYKPLLGKEWRLVKPQPTGTYLDVKMYSADRRILSRRIHRLVIEAFKGPKPSPEMECRHYDGNPHNNSIDNLFWGTLTDQRNDDYRNGALIHGEKHNFARYSDAVVAEIRQRLKNGQHPRDIAVEMKIPRSYVWRIKGGRRRKRTAMEYA